MHSKKTHKELVTENEELRSLLREAEETLAAIRNHEVDALVVQGPEGETVFTLQGADQPYRIFVEAMNEGAAIIDHTGLILHCNRHLAEMLGTPLNRVMGKPLYPFVETAGGHPIEDILKTCGPDGCKGEFILRARRRQKTPVYLSARSLRLNEIEAFCVVISDISERKRVEAELEKHRKHLMEMVEERTGRLKETSEKLLEEVRERKAAEEALREIEQRLQQALRVGRSFAFEWKVSTDEVLRSESCADILRLSGDEIKQDTGQGYFRRVHDDDREQLMGLLANLNSSRNSYHTEYRVVCNDGTVVTLEEIAEGFFDGQGNMQRVVGTTTDITARKKAEEELKASEKRFRSMFERHKAAMLLVEPESGAIVGANLAASKYYGYTREQLTSMHIQDINQLPPEKVAANRQKAVENLEDHFTFQHRLADGRVRWVDVYSSPFEAEGRTLLFSIIHDITERKASDALLREAYAQIENEKNRLAAVMDALPLGVALVDTRGGNILANKAFNEIWGHNRPAANSVDDYGAYKAWSIETGSPIRPEEWASVIALQKGETLIGQLLQIERFDGTSMFVHNSAAPIRSKAGEILGSAVAIMDITDQQMMKKNLEKTVERLNIISTTASELLFSSQPQEIVETLCRKVMEHLDCDVFFNFLVDEQMNCLRLNAYEGIPEEIARQIHLLDYGVAVCGCAAKDACRIVAENIPTTPDVRTDLVRSFGITAYACHPLLARGAVIGTLSFGTKSRFTFTEDELSLMKTVADQVATAMERIRLLEVEKNRASDLEQTVEKRTTQLRRQAELLDLSHDAIFLRDNEGRISYWNEGAEDTYGFTRDEAIGNTIQDLLKTKAEIPIQDIVDTVKHNGRWEGELTHVGKNGQEVTVHSRWALRVNEAGGPYEIMEVNRDITLRKQAENALRESEERYRVAIESASDGIALVKKDFHVFVNRRFAEIFGYDDPLEIIEKPLSLTVHPDDLDMVSEINLMRQMGEPVPSRYEFKGIKKDGSLRIMEVSAARTNYRGEPVSLAYLRDITDYKNLHDQLRQSQKMEAIGTLAGGIAHDFNNILAAIMGFAEMIEEDIPLGKPKVEHVQRVIHAASRGKELVQQILAFSRKAEYARYPVSLSAIAKETSQLLRASIPTTIDIILDLTATSDTILATPVEVQQILMNLVANAAHSMREKGGILHISIKDMYIDSQSPVLEGEMVPGEYAELVVSDTGTGMARDLMERIFEPFFTTREVGQGTGMGLAVVYGIVKGLHGSIRVESEPGVGSTFTIFFPKARVDLVANQPVSEQTQGNGERVLFVDDEEFLTEWGKDILERLGYEVMATNDSVEAFEAFTYDPSLFDVVVTDQTMPGLTGLQLARECLRVRPDIPIILCTGHSDSITPDTLKEGGIRELLMKPLVRKELAQAIHRVLNKDEEL